MTLKETIDRAFSTDDHGFRWTPCMIQRQLKLTEHEGEIARALTELGHPHEVIAGYRCFAIRLAKQGEAVKRTRKSR